MSDLTSTGDWEGKHVVVTTIGTLKKYASGGKSAMDLSALRVIVINDADFFFKDSRNQ